MQSTCSRLQRHLVNLATTQDLRQSLFVALTDSFLSPTKKNQKASSPKSVKDQLLTESAKVCLILETRNVI